VRSGRTSGSTDLQFVTIHGHQRAYRMMGSGPALLMLHGIGDSSETWVPLMAELARDFTVIAPDLLGHGASAKPRADYSVAAYANGMRDLLEVLGIETAPVVGHSLGGGVAAQFGYQYQDHCERLVLAATGGVNRAVTPFLRIASAPFAEVVLPTLQWPLGRIAATAAFEALRMLGTDLGRDAGQLQRVFDGLPDRSSRGAFTRTLRSVVDWRGQVVTMLDRAYLTESMPVLLMWGDHDGVIPVKHAHRAHAAMAWSQLSIYEGAGHFPHHFDPTRFVNEIRTFVAETEPASFDRERFRSKLRSGE